MAPLNFPSSPVNGQQYTANGKTWVYSTATSSWLSSTNLKVDTVAGKEGVVTLDIADIGGLTAALAAKAALASPALTGTPTAPTATGGTNTTQIATTAFVQSAISSLQNLDADLTAISALSGTGFLKRTGVDTWALDGSTYLTGNQSISVTGDATGSGTTSIALTLANSGVGAGTYRSVTVDAKGRVTAGTNPTTLSGYGITDALSNSSTSTQSGYFGDIFLYDDSTPSHYLGITNSANLTAARTLSLNVNDADRTISLSGNLTVSAAATISGTNTGDQTITLTGDVTGTGTGSFATTLKNTGTAGTYTKVTTDAQGRVTSGTTLAAGDIPALSYLPLTGGTLTGGLTESSATDQAITLNATDSSWKYIGFSWAGVRRSYFGIDNGGSPVWGVDSGTPNIAATSLTIGSNVVLHAGNYNSYALPLGGGTMTGAITFAAGQTWPTFNQNTTGSAATLTTGRTIGMTGDVTWTSAAFNGSANVTGTATLTNTAVTGQALTGYAVGTNTALAAADTILGAFQKVQGQINARLTGNQSITLSGDATGTGATAITVAISAATVTGKLLTGYAVGANTALAATDSILGAFQKVQGQIDNRLPLGGGSLGGTLTIANGGPVLVMKDTDSTGAAQLGYISFQDNGNVERAWIGYGSASSTNLNLQNGQGDVTIQNSIALHAANYSSYALPLTGGTLTGALGGTAATFSGLLTATAGAKIVVQSGTDGGNARGIFMWTNADSNWGIYMGQSGETKSLSGGTAATGLDGRVEHHIRFRAAFSTGQGFLWENSQEKALMSLTTDTGVLGVRGGIAGVGTNLATSKSWAIGTGTQTGWYGGSFGLNGSTSENQNLYRGDSMPTPFASPGLVWAATNNDASSDADGGWNKNIEGLDPNKTYRSIVWFRRNSSSTNGTWYHGLADCQTTTGSAVSNPYFNAQGLSAFVQGRWYLSVGYIHANNDATATSSYGGIYDSITGARVFSNTDFRMAAGQTTQMHRTYLYYSTDPAAVVEWWGPRFEEVNGDEPSVNALLLGSPDQKVVVTSQNVGTYALPIGGGTVTGQTLFTGGSGTTPGLVVNRNIASPSNYYNGLQLEVRATSGTAGIGLHRDGYSHVGIYHDAINTLKFNMSSGTVTMNHDTGTVLGTGNYSGYALPLSGGTMSGALSVSSSYGTMGGVRGSYYGYSTTYGAVVYGSTSGNITPCINVDPIANTSGAFSGLGNEVMFRNNVTFITPNAANNGYHTMLTLLNGTVSAGGALLQQGYQVLHANNYGSYALPLSGGTMSAGAISMATSGTSYIRMGRFPNSLNNTGEAWIGRASDRQAGVMTVQLGTDSNANFEVVDSAWTTVVFQAGMNSASYKNNALIHAGNYSSYALPLSGGSLTGNLSTTGGVYINNNNPTLFLQDTDNRSAMIHVNSNLFYVLRGTGNNSTGWSAYNGVWPMVLNLENNNADFGGSVTAVGDVTAYSDIRLKRDIERITEPVEKVMKIRGVTFFRTDLEHDQRRHAGVIAQEVEAVLPEVVSEDDKGNKHVAYGNMVGLLIEAIKEQQAEIVALRDEVRAMRGE